MTKIKSRSRTISILLLIGGFILGNMTRPLGERIGTISDRLLFQDDPRVAIDIDRIDPLTGTIYVTVQNDTDFDIICKYLDMSDGNSEPRFYDRLHPKVRYAGYTFDNLPPKAKDGIAKGSENRWGLVVGRAGITAAPASSRVVTKGITQVAFVSPGLLNCPLETVPRHPPFGAVNMGFSLSYVFDLGGDGDSRVTLHKILHDTRIQ